MNASVYSEAELGPNTVRAADEDGILVACRFEVENAAKAADLNVCARALGCPYQGLDGLDKGVTSVDVYTCLRVG